MFKLRHNHEGPNLGALEDCPACKAIKDDIIPAEDGFYHSEENNPEFTKLYYKTWDALEAADLLVELEPGMIDNTEILAIVRKKYAVEQRRKCKAQKRDNDTVVDMKPFYVQFNKEIAGGYEDCIPATNDEDEDGNEEM